MKICFIGAGKMATAIAKGLVDNQIIDRSDIIATDPLENARQIFTESTGVASTDGNRAAVAGASIVIVAVKPQIAAKVLSPLSGVFNDKLLISIAAGVSLNQLRGWTGADRIIRVMPNTPAMVGFGASAFACLKTATEDDRRLAKKILGAVGIVMELPEASLDAVTGLSGSGPAYVFEFVQAMIDAGIAAGLPADATRQLTLQTVRGAAEMLEREMGTPDELRDAVTSPGGTTAAGLKVLSDANFRGLICDVVRKATERSIELGKE